MSLSNREYIRVPPDGAGKAITTGHIHHVEYVDGTPASFVLGSTLVGATSGVSAVIIEHLAKTASTGHLNLRFSAAGEGSSFTIGEDLEIDNVVIGQVAAQEHYHVNQTELVGKNNPRYGQHVDVEGAAHMRFTSGSPQFDAAGRQEVSQENWIGTYAQKYDENPDLIDTTLTSGGTLTYDTASSTSELLVDDVSGSSVVRQSHLYHNYRSGVPMSTYMTVAADAATANCRRRWGYFDVNDGLYFEYDGSTMNVVIRSSTTGSIVERRVPQSEWNGDRLNGSLDIETNPSQLTIDPSQFYLYQISFLYLGAGPVVFAAFIGGRRVVLHTFHNGGNSPMPYMRTGTLPVRWEITNTGATSGPTQLRQGNSTVILHGDWAPQRKTFGSPFRAPVPVNAETAVAVIRAKQTNPANGQDNRGIVIPTELRVYSATEPVHVALTRGGDFTIDTWFSDYPDGLLEQGILAGGAPTIVDAGHVTSSTLVNPGEIAVMDLSKTFSVRSDGEVIRQADITQWINHAVICQSLTGVATDITVSFNWDEIT